MNSGGEQVDSIFAAFGVGSAVDGLVIEVEDIDGDGVGIVVVVAVARTLG